MAALTLCGILYDDTDQDRQGGLAVWTPKSRAGSAATSTSTRPGRQAGYLRAPLSRNTSGWGTSRSRSSSVKNGTGPTILFTGGVHGDEYEGRSPSRGLRARSIRPRCRAGHHDAGGQHPGRHERHAPVAGRQPRHEPLLSGKSARHLLRNAGALHRARDPAHVDVSVDLHTCGHSGDSALSTNMHYVPDQAMRGRRWPRPQPSARPSTSFSAASTRARRSPRAVERRGILSLGTELGGWGRVNIEGVRIGRRGIHNIMRAPRGDRGRAGDGAARRRAPPRAT